MGAEQAEPVNCGVLLVASGQRYIEAAVATAENLKQHMPDIPVVLFTGDPGSVASPSINQVIGIENPHSRSKVECLVQTPFDRTLYIDTDVRIVADISGVFQVLERFDMALGHAHARMRAETQAVWRKPLPAAFPQFNCGVILYRNSPASTALLTAWSGAYEDAKFKKDQVTFRELAWESDARIYVLPPEYNVRYKKYFNIWKSTEARPLVLHLREFHERHSPLRSKLRWRAQEFFDDFSGAVSLGFAAIVRLFRPRGRLR